MKKFIKKVMTFALIFAVLTVMIVTFDRMVLGNQYTGSYQASLLDKKERYLSINEPKLILIGNSNLAFGMDSEKLQEAVGMPVVNMGLHGGLGNIFHENMLKYGLNKGDIVVICHTSYGDGDDVSEADLFLSTLEWHYDLWSLAKPQDIPAMFSGIHQYSFTSLLSWVQGNKERTPKQNNCYSRSAFNKYGDVVVKPETKKVIFVKDSITIPEIKDSCTDRLNKLNKTISEQGATMLVAAYPIAYCEYTPEPEKYDEFESQLRSKLDCDVISNFTDYFIPSELFYNTKYHLSEEGTKLRTELLINDIQNWKASSDKTH